MKILQSEAFDDCIIFSADRQNPVPRHPPFAYANIGKRLFDVVLALAILPVILPILALVWLLVKRDGGPGYFGHLRVGRDGRTFRCWKLRTMVVDAENKLAQHLATNAQAAEEWARDFKLRDDPRVTSWGRFLRKSSLDELPQIWNVLRGEMSFVGPRPVVARELDLYGADRASYCALRPGITGLWQVSGRNSLAYSERVRLDVVYAKSCSFWRDLNILRQTFRAVLGQTGV